MALEAFDNELAYLMLDEPAKFLSAAMGAIREMHDLGDVDIFFRPVNLPDQGLTVSSIRAVNVGEMVTLKGRVRKAKGTSQKIEMGGFRCRRCFHVQHIPQESFDLSEPLECAREEEGGCGRQAGQTRFDLLDQESTFKDYQIIHLEEHFDLAKQHQPETIRCVLFDDITGLGPVNDIIVHGIVTTRMLRYKKTATPETYISVVSYELPEDLRDASTLTDEDVKEIKALAAEPDIFQKLIDSIAPHIKGEETVKEAVVVTLFGGVRKTLPDGSTIRGNSHILIVGDPSMAKSKILEYAASCAPMSMYSDGAGSSGAGLTFAVVKDNLDGQWTVEMGVIPMCNRGTAIIDELDKMSDEDTKRMHVAMESEKLPYAKAGLVGTLQARTAIIAGGNPKHGRFQKDEPIPQQVDLPPALVSRFDLIFALEDKPDPKIDLEKAKYVLDTHTYWQSEDYTRKPEIAPDLMRKMVAYARQNIHPRISAEANDKLVNYYTNIRRINQGEDEDIIPVTLRQLEGAVRLSESCARIRHSEIVEIMDVDRAVSLIEKSLYGFGWNEGVMDIDLIETKRGQAQRRDWKAVLSAIEDHDHSGKGAREIDLETDPILMEMGITGHKLQFTLRSMSEDKQIYQYRSGRWKKIGT